MKNILLNIISDNKVQKNISTISVCFEDLNTKECMTVNGFERFVPGCLLKTHVLIAYLKKLQENSGIALEKVSYDTDSFLQIPWQYPFKETLVPGIAYTIEDLTKRMVVHSDVSAAELLSKYLGNDFLLQTYRGLGLSTQSFLNSKSSFTGNPADFMTITEYAPVFPALFFGSYLGKESSEVALALLSQTDFQNGLRAGVPEDIQVAHAESVQCIKTADVQVHDCGIIYYPGRPYALSIMGKGQTEEGVTETIKEISHAVFEFVNVLAKKSIS